MDAREQFPVDMVEQMLKFTPSPEERAHHLARADRFLFELSKWVHCKNIKNLLIDHLARADRFLFELSKWVVHGVKIWEKWKNCVRCIRLLFSSSEYSFDPGDIVVEEGKNPFWIVET